MVFDWLKSRRRRRVLAEPFPLEWDTILRRRVRQFQYLPPQQQQRVRDIVQVMAAEKEWAPAAGFAVTDEMRVTIAGVAGMMASALDEPYFYDRLSTFVIHPHVIRFSPERAAVNPNLPDSSFLDGVAWQGGPVLVSWAAVRDERRGPSQGRNVVVHELAHHLDGLNGAMDGVPPLPAEAASRWDEVMDQELAWLEEDVRRGVDTLLDEGGAESPAELFAVASECFFELPHDMHREHPELYRELTQFYRQSPIQWMPR